MFKELIKEKISLDRKIGKQTTQVLIEGDLIVPDMKPDMSVVLQTNSQAVIDRIELTSDRVSFIGKLDIQILYLARGSQNPVHSMNVSMSIDDFINMDGVTKETQVDALCEIAHIDYRMVNDRKLNYRAIVDVLISASNPETHEIVVDINDVPANQLLKNSVTLTKNIESRTERFAVKDLLTVESGKPNIREILQTNMSISNKDCRISGGKVNISGELVLKILYRGDNESSVIDLAEHEIPFTHSIDIAGITDDMFSDAVLTPLDQYVQIQADSDGESRVISIEVTVSAGLKIASSQSIEVLEDAYCINKVLNLNKVPAKYSKLMCHNKTQSPAKEIVALDDASPDILQIFAAHGKSFVHEIKVVEDKVIAEGSIEANVLYIAESDEMPLYSYKAELPFRQIIETKGATPDMEVSIAATIEHVSFNMLSGREMELRFLVSFNTSVYREKEMHIIADIDFDDMDKSIIDSMPSMTIYVVQKGDDLWKIAKRYNTSIDELLAVNDIEKPTGVVPGQKLLVLKKVE